MNDLALWLGFLAGVFAGAGALWAGFRAGYRLGVHHARNCALKCDYFFSYPGERCRLTLGHEGKHIPPAYKGDA